MAEEVGTYTLPVILSFEGVDKQVNSKLGKAFEGVSRKASKGLGDGMKAAAADVDKLAASYSKLKDKADDALGKVRSDEAALQKLRTTGASDDRIVKAEERLATSRRNSSRALRDATGAHDELKNAQGKLGDSNDRLGGKFSGLSDLAGTAGTALRGAGVIAAGAAVVGIGALAVGVVAAGKALYDLGAEFDDVFDNIRIKTGATGPQLEQLEKATERLSTKVPLSIGEIGNVVAETSRALHLTGPDLDNVARSIANLGRLTGENVDVRTLGKAFRGFGVDAKDQVPALDSLLRASQTTGVGVNELLATVVKGGAGLRQFGFTFGESAALATQFEDAGLDSTKALAGFTKGLATLAKDGQTGQDALRANVDQIKALTAAGNDAAALDLTNKLFGAKGGVQFFEAIKNGALDLDALAGSVGDTGDTIAQAAEDTDDWAERWQLFKNSIKVGLEPIGTGVFDAVNGKLTELADWVDNHKPEVIGFFGDLAATITTKTAEALRGISSFIGDGLVPILRAVEDFGKNNVLANLIPGAEELGGAAGILADGLNGLPGTLNNAATSIDSITPKIKTLADRTADAQRFVGALGDATASLPDGKTIELSSNAPEVVDGLKALGIEVVSLPGGKIGVTADTDEGKRIIDAFRDQETKAPITPSVLPKLETDGLDVSIGNYFKNLRPIINPAIASPESPWRTTVGNPVHPPGGFTPTPHRAQGGIYNVWDQVASFANGKLPNQAMIQAPVAGAGLVQWAEPATDGEAFIPLASSKRGRSLAIWRETGRRLDAFDDGGIRGIDALYAEAQALSGTKYSRESGDDCSGTVSQLVNAMLGLSPKADRMSTMTASRWLAQKGAYPGLGPVGTFTMGWKNGGPGGGHMAATLPDGTNVEMGGANGGYTLGGNAKGADDPEFTDHAYFPMEALYPDGVASGGASSPYGSGGAGGGGGGTPGVGPNGESGTYSAPDAKDLREANQKVADADVRVRESEAKQRELDADAKESQKISAQADVDKAKREAADARADLSEVQKGKFSAGKSGGGKSDMSDIGSIFKSFFTETFGLDGSWLPDIGNLMPLKMVDTLLGAFAPAGGDSGGGAGGGGGGGGLGGLLGLVPNAQTSSSPFGVPDVMAPPMPPDGVHLGTGTPGPINYNSFDLSNNSTANGMDPDQVRKDNLKLQDRGIARINGIPMAAGN